MTKVQKLEAIVNILDNSGADTEYIDCIEAIIASEARKAERAAERAAEKKAAGDELRAVVKSVLTSELEPIEKIVDAVNANLDEEVEPATIGKVRNRINQLVSLGEARKDNITVEDEDGKKKHPMGYALA